MKFRVNRQAFAAALAQVFALAPPKSPKEVLRNVLARVEGDRLELQATDLEISLILSVAVEEATSGACLLPPRILHICREASGEFISLEMAESGKAEIEAGFGSWSLQTDDPVQFPIFQPINMSPVQIPGEAFSLGIERTRFATDDQSTRYALGSILLECEGSLLTLAATDSRRLSVHPLGLGSDHGEWQALLPTRAAQHVSKVAEGQESLSIAVSGRMIAITAGTSCVQARQTEGKFPRYRDIIPHEHAWDVRMVAGPLYAAVRQSMIVAGKDSGVTFEFHDGNLTIKSEHADIGASRISVPADIQDSTDPAVLSLDPRFVMDFLKTVDAAEPVQILIRDGSSPVQFKAAGTNYLLMPLSRE